MTSVADVGVVIAAGGAGTRAGGPELKQFRWVAGKPMLLHSVQLFQRRPDVAMVVCVLPRHVAGDPPPWLFQADTDRLLVTPGGETRVESVRHGLEDLPAACRVVLVHDAARPLVPDAVVDRVVAAARRGVAAVPALPVVDTLKQADASGSVVRTVARDGLWRVQTPQGFPREMVLAAHQHALAQGIDATDDAALCEMIGHEVVVVRGSERAMKITDETDFARADALAGLSDS